jgi:hypothetical protein
MAKGARFSGCVRGAKKRAAKMFFTPCMGGASLLKKTSIAARGAASGDVILISPACSFFDQFQTYRKRDGVCPDAAEALAATIGRGVRAGHPNTQAGSFGRDGETKNFAEKMILRRVFLRKKPGANKPTTNPTSRERTPTGVIQP